jgi:type I site-specific restriction endonuclease
MGEQDLLPLPESTGVVALHRLPRSEAAVRELSASIARNNSEMDEQDERCARLQQISLNHQGLRDCQITAPRIWTSFKDDRPRALIRWYERRQTYTAITSIYRLSNLLTQNASCFLLIRKILANRRNRNSRRSCRMTIT